MLTRVRPHLRAVRPAAILIAVAMLSAGCVTRGVDGVAVGGDTRDPSPAGVVARSASAGISYLIPSGFRLTARKPEHGEVDLSATTSSAMILLGRLDDEPAAAEQPTDRRAAADLAAQLGNHYFPEPGDRVDIDFGAVTGARSTGASVYYRVEFDRSSRTDAEVFTAVVGTGERRWWMAWLTDSADPVDRELARAAAAAITPL